MENKSTIQEVGKSDHASSGRFKQNEAGTGKEIDTPLTQPSSRHVRFAVVSRGGDAITGFDSATAAADWARRTWPGQEQDETRSGKGWDIEVVS